MIFGKGPSQFEQMKAEVKRVKQLNEALSEQLKRWMNTCQYMGKLLDEKKILTPEIEMKMEDLLTGKATAEEPVSDVARSN